MRVHFAILSLDQKSVHVALLNQDLDAQHQVSVSAVAAGGRYEVVSQSFIGTREQSMISRHIIRGFKASSPKIYLDELCQYLLASYGRQVVWDERLKKFRNVTTMKDEESLYQAKGITPIMVTGAADEDRAKSRLSVKITNAMTETPSSAASLAKWFAEGRPVMRIENGAAPEAIDLKKLGGVLKDGKPIVLRIKKEKTEKKGKD